VHVFHKKQASYQREQGPMVGPYVLILVILWRRGRDSNLQFCKLLKRMPLYVHCLVL